MTAGRDWERLSDFVISWRERLSLERSDLAERMKMDAKTVQRIENGQSVRATSLAALERGLGWKPGSARTVLGGGDPAPIDEPEEEPEVSLDDLRATAESAIKLGQEMLEKLDQLERQERRRAM
ncbi:helix-turn-helix domain-containing protein [Saccharopolyspora sp. NPDC002686]|uniref:helix-turn-helix domain-containing protein n=1 Tax=Saccharopolyspora sp. NPDC002686 TaxID=3154541 RepID=UPI003319623A